VYHVAYGPAVVLGLQGRSGGKTKVLSKDIVIKVPDRK